MGEIFLCENFNEASFEKQYRVKSIDDLLNILESINIGDFCISLNFSLRSPKTIQMYEYDKINVLHEIDGNEEDICIKDIDCTNIGFAINAGAFFYMGER